MQWSFDAVTGGIAYDLFKYYVLGPLIVSLLSTVILKSAFHKLQEKREVVIYSAGSFFVCMALFFFIGTRPQQPDLIGSISQVVTGIFPGSERDEVSVITVGMVNTGGMQSVVKGWNVKASANGVTYQGTFVPIPQAFTFNNIPKINDDQPEAITFKGEDDIVQRGLLPIQTGAFLQGTLFVVFRNVDPTIFKGVVEYTVNYQDVLSKNYSMVVKSTGQMSAIGLAPGLHTEAVCRGPAWQPPADTTGTIPGTPQLNFSPLPKHG